MLICKYDGCICLQALLRTQVDCGYAGSLDVLEAVVSAETSARQLKRAVETQQTLDVHVDSTDSACVLREVSGNNQQDCSRACVASVPY